MVRPNQAQLALTKVQQTNTSLVDPTTKNQRSAYVEKGVRKSDIVRRTFSWHREEGIVVLRPGNITQTTSVEGAAFTM